MIDFSLPYVDILFFAGILSTLLGILIWKRKHISGSYALALTIFSVMIWTLAGAFEGSALSEPTKILLSKIQYIGIVNLPPFFLLFVLIYTGRVKNPYQIKNRTPLAAAGFFLNLSLDQSVAPSVLGELFRD